MSQSLEIKALQQRLLNAGYIADRSLAATLHLHSELQRPLLLEGDAGVGKTEVGKILSRIYDCPLIRLQCYEGLDINTAVYEWNYHRQLLAIKQQEQSTHQENIEKNIFSDDYLLKRPLLQAIIQEKPPVLLIDEIDRADEEFEAYLLEVLSDFQISIPELGTIKATSRPYVILTSNGTRELSDALRRRCLYHYVEYPDFDKELKIVNTQLPDVSLQLSRQVVAFVQNLRKSDLRKKPGIAETLDWTAALLRLDVSALEDDLDAVMDSLTCLLKTREDSASMDKAVVERMIARAI